jgi:hypothetical protein
VRHKINATYVLIYGDEASRSCVQCRQSRPYFAKSTHEVVESPVTNDIIVWLRDSLGPFHGGSWKPPWVRRVGGDSAPVIAMNAMYHRAFGVRFGGSGGSVFGSDKVGGCHSKSSNGTTKGLLLSHGLISSSSPRVRSTPRISFLGCGVPSTRSSSSYSPDLSWISQACGKSVSKGSWGGAVNGDRRSFAQVLKFIPAPIVMVPPRPHKG